MLQLCVYCAGWCIAYTPLLYRLCVRIMLPCVQLTHPSLCCGTLVAVKLAASAAAALVLFTCHRMDAVWVQVQEPELSSCRALSACCDSSVQIQSSRAWTCMVCAVRQYSYCRTCQCVSCRAMQPLCGQAPQQQRQSVLTQTPACNCVCHWRKRMCVVSAACLLPTCSSL